MAELPEQLQFSVQLEKAHKVIGQLYLQITEGNLILQSLQNKLANVEAKLKDAEARLSPPPSLGDDKPSLPRDINFGEEGLSRR